MEETIKWYQNPHWCTKQDYVKGVIKGSSVIGEEFISSGTYHKCPVEWSSSSSLREVLITEIQQYLPDGHPDKLIIPLVSATTVTTEAELRVYKAGDWVKVVKTDKERFPGGVKMFNNTYQLKDVRNGRVNLDIKAAGYTFENSDGGYWLDLDMVIKVNPKTMSKSEYLQEEATKRFPVGSSFIPAHTRQDFVKVEPGDYFKYDGSENMYLYYSTGAMKKSQGPCEFNSVVYFGGTWAEPVTTLPVISNDHCDKYGHKVGGYVKFRIQLLQFSKGDIVQINKVYEDGDFEVVGSHHRWLKSRLDGEIIWLGMEKPGIEKPIEAEEVKPSWKPFKGMWVVLTEDYAQLKKGEVHQLKEPQNDGKYCWYVYKGLYSPYLRKMRPATDYEVDIELRAKQIEEKLPEPKLEPVNVLDPFDAPAKKHEYKPGEWVIFIENDPPFIKGDIVQLKKICGGRLWHIDDSLGIETKFEFYAFGHNVIGMSSPADKERKESKLQIPKAYEAIQVKQNKNKFKLQIK